MSMPRDQKEACMTACHKEMIDGQIFRSCLNCDHWGSETDMCGKFEVKPPAEVIVFSCPEWFPDIPF
jgi:hypothetical protein